MLPLPENGRVHGTCERHRQEALMDERTKRDRDMDMEQDLLSEMERDTEIKRATNVRNALGPVEERGDSEAAESGIATDERQTGRSRSGRANRPERSDEEV
jgi:hypothetical protein